MEPRLVLLWQRQIIKTEERREDKKQREVEISATSGMTEQNIRESEKERGRKGREGEMGKLV